MTNVISLNGLNEEDEEFQKFLETLQEGNANAIFLIEKEDGTVTVGSNFKDRRDLVYAIYNLENLARDIVGGVGEGEYLE